MEISHFWQVHLQKDPGQSLGGFQNHGNTEDLVGRGELGLTMGWGRGKRGTAGYVPSRLQTHWPVPLLQVAWISCGPPILPLA